MFITIKLLKKVLWLEIDLKYTIFDIRILKLITINQRFGIWIYPEVILEKKINLYFNIISALYFNF